MGSERGEGRYTRNRGGSLKPNKNRVCLISGKARQGFDEHWRRLPKEKRDAGFYYRMIEGKGRKKKRKDFHEWQRLGC